MKRPRFLSFFDERYFRHRYRATSHAAMVAAVLLGGMFFFDSVVRHRVRWDLAAVLLAMAVTKLAAMLYYRCRE